jgi:DNA invertase Pin-like site-specific DNA recombinase
MRAVIYCYCDPLLDPAPSVLSRDVEAVYLDLGGRAEWARLLLDLQAQPETTLWLPSLGDLGDSPGEIGARLRQLQALGIQGKCLAEDKSLADLAPGLAWPELENLAESQQSRRLRRGHAHKRRQGLPPPGKAPYGYRKTPERYVIDRSAAPLVKTFCEQFLRLGSLRGAVRYLAQTYGKKISLTTARRWLTHPVYRGDLLYQNQIVIPNTHNPILSREDGAQIDRLLGQNRSRPPRSASAPRALAGLVRCPLCQSLWVVNALKKPRPYLYLRPQSCPQTPKCAALNYDAVLGEVIAQICAQFPNREPNGAENPTGRGDGPAPDPFNSTAPTPRKRYFRRRNPRPPALYSPTGIGPTATTSRPTAARGINPPCAGAESAPILVRSFRVRAPFLFAGICPGDST